MVGPIAGRSALARTDCFGGPNFVRSDCWEGPFTGPIAKRRIIRDADCKEASLGCSDAPRLVPRRSATSFLLVIHTVAEIQRRYRFSERKRAESVSFTSSCQETAIWPLI